MREGLRLPSCRLRGGGGLIGWLAGGISCRHFKEKRRCLPVPSQSRGCTSDKEEGWKRSPRLMRLAPCSPFPGPPRVESRGWDIGGPLAQTPWVIVTPSAPRGSPALF